ncbi:hypothetical protein BaRGS_00018570 [Batillaria attramentaria]|uniref:Uncharacterized protein n=1 Tax=Batillaria attramentaria TaxID=370345 RepID=A0ABD0KTS0_9CAEN
MARAVHSPTGRILTLAATRAEREYGSEQFRSVQSMCLVRGTITQGLEDIRANQNPSGAINAILTAKELFGEMPGEPQHNVILTRRRRNTSNWESPVAAVSLLFADVTLLCFAGLPDTVPILFQLLVRELP